MTFRRDLILATLSDCVSNFLYDGRKEDEQLSTEDIDDAILAGEVSIDDLLEHFEKELREGLGVEDGEEEEP